MEVLDTAPAPDGEAENTGWGFGKIGHLRLSELWYPSDLPSAPPWGSWPFCKSLGACAKGYGLLL